MDKKKVKEHIQRALEWIDPMTTESANYETAFEMAAKNLEFAIQELSKSDWVSVEDELPEYNKKVYVCSKFNNRYTAAIRLNTGDYHYDNNGFLEWLNVTHWKPIEKLEV